MSAELMQKAFEISASDPNLTALDKLVLIRWAWKTIDPATPYEIKFRVLARELGASRNGIKASVNRLNENGYLRTIAVKVVAGAAFQIKENATPTSEQQKSGGQGVTPKDKKGEGQGVTPKGSVSDPQKGQSVTPFKKKKEKRARARAENDAPSRGEGQSKARCPIAFARYQATAKPGQTFNEWQADQSKAASATG